MKVYTVFIAIHRLGTPNNVSYKADLIFTDHGPLLVAEWDGPRGSTPAVTIPLDAAKLRPGQAMIEADYYDPEPVLDPRPMH